MLILAETKKPAAPSRSAPAIRSLSNRVSSAYIPNTAITLSRSGLKVNQPPLLTLYPKTVLSPHHTISASVFAPLLGSCPTIQYGVLAVSAKPWALKLKVVRVSVVEKAGRLFFVTQFPICDPGAPELSL